MKNLDTAFLSRSSDLASRAHTQLTAARVLTAHYSPRSLCSETYSQADLAWFSRPGGR